MLVSSPNDGEAVTIRPVASAGVDRCSDAIVFVPGVLGSELVDRHGTVVWGMNPRLVLRQAALGDVLARLALSPDGSDDGIRASRVLQLPMRLPLLCGVEPYARLLARLRATALRPEAVCVFPYDWRRSIVDAARGLATVAERHLAAWRARWETLPLEERRHLPEPSLTLVCHSMGGLVGRWFAEVEGGRGVVRRVVTLGTPFAGSLNALRVLANGHYLPFGLLARSLRDSGRSFPGLYELVARYPCVTEPDEGAGEVLRDLRPADVAAVGGDREMAEDAFDVHRRLQEAVAAAGGSACSIHALVGVRQPTAQSVRLEAGTASFAEQYDGIDHRGDGTVYRYAAAPRGVRPMPLPQSHASLARSDEALAFVEAALTERDLAAVQAPEGGGVRIEPEVVTAGGKVRVIGLDGQVGAVATVVEVYEDVGASRERAVASAILYPSDGGTAAAELALPRPGLYRVSVALGGYSAVEHLVLAVAEP